MRKILRSTALGAAALLVLTGCSAANSAGNSAGTEATEGELVRVVASTNVYGSLAAEVGGDHVEVTSLIASAAKDPHSYEASARDRLAVQKADLVIENGGGYDAFMQELRDGSEATVITAVEFSHDFPGADSHEDAHAEDAHADEHDHEGHSHIEGFNEHVWFDAHTVTHVVEQIVADLIELDPAGASAFADAGEELIAELAVFEDDLSALHEKHEGQKVFITEPLPGLLASAAGLDDVAPHGFASSVEEGSDVAPAILLDALEILRDGDVRAVLTTAQTGGAETTRIVGAAEQAGVPVVTFSELLDADQSYAEWMRAAVDDLSTALSR